MTRIDTNGTGKDKTVIGMGGRQLPGLGVQKLLDARLFLRVRASIGPDQNQLTNFERAGLPLPVGQFLFEPGLAKRRKCVLT